MSASKPSALERTAFHEAGHTVAAFIMGRGVREASIVPDPTRDNLGHCAHFAARKPLDELSLSEPTWRLRRRVEAGIIGALAGSIAKRLRGKRFNHVAADGDYRACFDLAALCCGSLGEAEAFIAWLTRRAELLLRQPQHWQAVTATAEALLKHKRISGRRARRLWQESRTDADGYARAEAFLTGLPSPG